VASSLTRRLAELEARAVKAETELKKLKGTVVAHSVALKDKDK
jgi:uncharacterized coiled-coil protein SlyX